MTLPEALLRQLDDPALSRDEGAVLRCQIAADFEHRGQYESARHALANLWQGVSQRPALEGLTEHTAAKVLMRVGALSGWLASAAQDEHGQAAAKDLLSESITRFEALGERVDAAAAQSELGYCYWREGAYDEARVIYADALGKLTAQDDRELRAKIIIRRVLVESCTGRLNDSLRMLTDASRLFEESTNHALKGKYHNELGLVLRKLGTSERRPDYVDRAILEYTAASYHFEQAGHTGYRASAENNLGFLLYTIGRFTEAHEHLNRARLLFQSVKDKGRIAQVDDARARVFLAEGRTREAVRASRDAVETLERGGEQSVLAEALTTHGRVLSRLGNFSASQDTLRRAAGLAEQSGAAEDAGLALLTLVEEHAARLDEHELLETYRRADNLLKGTQDAEVIKRMRACAGHVISARLAVLALRRGRRPSDFWANFSLTDKVRAYEARYIRQALVDAQGSVTRAARLLGLKHHATLAAILEGRHKSLTHLRTPVEERRQSITRARQSGPKPAKAQPLRILHVEDNKLVADAVRETLELEGRAVVACDDGATALNVIEGRQHFDLLLFDNDLPHVNGLELVRRARQLPHRKRAPIIMLSASDVEREAWRAGVDAFLQKPEDVGRLSEMVTRVLARKK